MFCLSLTPIPYWLYFKKVRAHYETSAQVVAAELAQMEQLDRELYQVEVQKRTLSESVQMLESINAQKSHWVRFLRDLNVRLADVKDVWLDSLEYAKDAQGNVSENRLELSGGLLVSQEALLPESGFARETASLRIYDLVDNLSNSEFIAEVHEVGFF